MLEPAIPVLSSLLVPSMPNPRVILRARHARPFFGMHPWVYAGAIEAVSSAPGDGAAVDLVSHTGEFIASGFYNSQSKIRVRLFSWSPDAALMRISFADSSKPPFICAVIFCNCFGQARRVGSCSAKRTGSRG